jgi:xanthine dehydrogenase YagR molybdenum-binding subunit
VVVRLGDSSFPVSSGSGGQFGGNCSTAGDYAACVKLREAIAQKLGPISSPMKAKGIAELGICGVAAAVANAVYNATGVRVRD